MDGRATGLPPAGVFADAIAAGHLTAREVVKDGAELRPVGLSHDVWRLSVGGRPRLFLKAFGRRRGDTDGDPERETIVAALAEGRPALRTLVPRRLDWPHVPAVPQATLRGVVAHAAVAGRSATGLDTYGGGDHTGPAAWDAILDGLVPGLAAAHRATRDLAREEAPLPREPLPWVLRLADADGPEDIWTDPPLHAFLAPVLDRPGMVAGLRAARGAWRAMCLIHGDLKHDNLVVGDDGGVVAVDWEAAMIGDPAWDLAGLYARAVMTGPAPLAQSTLTAGARLLARYGDASRLSVPPLAARLALYTGAWLTMAAIQCRSGGGDAAEAGAWQHADAAAALLARPTAVASALIAEAAR